MSIHRTVRFVKRLVRVTVDLTDCITVCIIGSSSHERLEAEYYKKMQKAVEKEKGSVMSRVVERGRQRVELN